MSDNRVNEYRILESFIWHILLQILQIKMRAPWNYSSSHDTMTEMYNSLAKFFN